MKRINKLAACLLAAMAFSGYALTTNTVVQKDTIIDIAGRKVQTKVHICTQEHPDGCHNGGLHAISCSIDHSYYPCLGAIGGDCGVSCAEGYYACCGKYCRCLENPKTEKAEKAE